MNKILHSVICIVICCLSTTYLSAQANIAMGTSSATGQSSFAAGDSSEAIGGTSLAMGNKAKAIGEFSLSLGDRTMATGKWSQAFGFGSHAEGDYSLASGFFNRAWTFGVAIGAANYAATDGAVAIGRNNNAFGISSSVMGTWSTARSYGETVLGAYSEDYTRIAADVFQWEPEDRLFVIANGHGDGAGNGRYSNALTMLKNGDTQLNGKLRIGQSLTLPTIGARSGDYLRANERGDLLWTTDHQDLAYAGASYPLTMIPKETLGNSILDSIEIVGSGEIADTTQIKVCLDIKHEALDELEVSINTPGGDRIILINGLAGSHMSNTCFSSQSTVNISSAAAPYAGEYMPLNSFTAFLGEDINGIWTLEIEDDGGPTDEGILNAWTLTIDNYNGAIRSSGNSGNGFVADLNGKDGYKSSNNMMNGFYAASNDSYGFYAVDNTESGYSAEMNDENGFYAKDNILDGFYSELNDENGYTAMDNAESGYYAELNEEYGFHAKENDKDGFYAELNGDNGFYAFNNDKNGFLAQDNTIGYESKNDGTGFKAASTTTGIMSTAPTAADLNGAVMIDGDLHMDGDIILSLGRKLRSIGQLNIDSPLDVIVGANNLIDVDASVVNVDATASMTLGAPFTTINAGTSMVINTPSVVGINNLNVSNTITTGVLVAGACTCPSDVRLKTILDRNDNGMLDKINSLTLHSYQYKTEEYKDLCLPAGDQYGFIAQEIEEVFPDLVNAMPSFNKDGSEDKESSEFLGVNYVGLVPMLTKGIQELSDENQRLKQENKEIKERLARIEALILAQSDTD